MSEYKYWPLPDHYPATMVDWPAKELWPNRRYHWHAKRQALRKWRDLAFSYTPPRQLPSGGFYLVIAAFPPDRRKRDRDNLVAALKSAIDGMMLRLGRDDSILHPLPPIILKPDKYNPRVELYLIPEANVTITIK